MLGAEKTFAQTGAIPEVEDLGHEAANTGFARVSQAPLAVNLSGRGALVDTIRGAIMPTAMNIVSLAMILAIAGLTLMVVTGVLT
ncbi:hypothetical protein [Ponticoccus litoralis]|uniref:ABC transporter permease n=1 Tax=Ponticoccus litoralis TaxID=422297 RepID=A0AAW9SIR2_9RHOB